MSPPTDKQVSAFWRSLGGSAMRVDEEQFRKWIHLNDEVPYGKQWFYDAPSFTSCGIDYENKILAYYGEINWGAVIHEAGHVFVDFLYRNGAYASDEVDWLGWEIVAARYLGVYDDWLVDQKDYVINDRGDDIRHMMAVDPKKMHRTFAERIRHAREQGYVKRHRDAGRYWLKPVALR